jgi:hypothetical protein
MTYIGFVICSNTLEAANGYRFLLNSTPPTGWLARSVAGSPKHTWKNIGNPIDHICFREFLLGNQSDVFRHRSMGGTGILTVHYLVIILRIRCICRIQTNSF